jgi:NitT/TauT family transport system ATP-binding protein
MTSETMPSALELRSVCYERVTGRERRRLVGPVSFEVGEAEFVSVLGPSACGKTTLLKLLAGILPPTSGEIRITDRGDGPGRRSLGISLESPALLPWRTTMRNILLQAELQNADLEEAANRARRLLAWFGMSGMEDRLPHEQPPGAARVISVCRALVQNPFLLLLDEPFRTLDPLVLETILDGFQRLWMERRSTAVVFTRNMSEAVLLSDRVIVLSAAPGRVLQTIAVDLPRPRRFDKSMSPAIAEYCSRIRTVFQAQGVLP